MRFNCAYFNFCYFNFCRYLRGLISGKEDRKSKKVPAEEAGITIKKWTLDELLNYRNKEYQLINTGAPKTNLEK